MNRLLIILAFLLLEMPNLTAQDNQIEREFSGNFGFGGILAHNKSVRHLAQSHPVQIGLEYFLRNPLNPFGSKMKNAGLGYGLHYIDYRSEKWLEFLWEKITCSNLELALPISAMAHIPCPIWASTIFIFLLALVF